MNIQLEDAKKSLEYLEVIRTSLAKIGSHSDDSDEVARILYRFTVDYNVFNKISYIWRVFLNQLSEEIDDTQIDDFFEKIKYWEVPKRTSKDDLGNLIKNI